MLVECIVHICKILIKIYKIRSLMSCSLKRQVTENEWQQRRNIAINIKNQKLMQRMFG